MRLAWEQLVVDARDPVALAQWWQQALGWVVVNDDPEEFEIRASADALPVPAAVEDAAPNGGDGNHDQTDDALQANVTSLPAGEAGSGYVTVAAPEGLTLTEVATASAANYPALPSGLQATTGVTSFAIPITQPGTVAVSIYFDPPVPDGSPYFKLRNGAWQQVATTAASAVTFTLSDGGPLDTDGVANGVIHDPGALGLAPVTGFQAPIDNSSVNVAKAGSTVPVKWRLTGPAAADPSTFVAVRSTAGSCLGLPADAVETYSGGSGLQYLGDGYWQWNWKTPASYKNQCRTMTLVLTVGGEERTLQAAFLFK